MKADRRIWWENAWLILLRSLALGKRAVKKESSPEEGLVLLEAARERCRRQRFAAHLEAARRKKRKSA